MAGGYSSRCVESSHPQRTASRYKLFKPDTIDVRGRSARVHVLNLSVGGALVYAAEPLAKGSRLRLALCDREARVVWSNGKRFGISFDRPIPLDQVQSIVADHDALIHVASKRLPPLAA